MFSTGFRHSDDNLAEKLLPCITFYAMSAYKTDGFHYSKEDFQKQTYDIEEFFHPQTLWELKNRSMYLLIENRSLFFGRGYTVCHLEKVVAKKPIYFRLRNIFDIQLYTHSKGEEFLVGLSVYPVEVIICY